MKLFLKRNKHFLFLLLIFICAELIINPLGNFPLNDDWSFAQSAIIFEKSGSIFPGNFPAMSLCTQIVWGAAFIKLFGVSLVALRFSTIVSAVVGFAFLNKLILQITNKRNLAFFACLVLMFSPMVFNLTNTFMTDVNFNTLAILCCYFMYNFFRSRRILYFILFVLFSVFLVLLRQYGMIFPACFIAACFFVKEKKVQNIALAVLGFVIAYASLKIYEQYLRGTLPEGSAYKFSGNTHITSRVFWDMFFESFGARHKEIMRQTLLYAMPFVLVFAVKAVQQCRAVMLIAAAVVSTLLTYYLFTDLRTQSYSVFDRMILGNESFYETTQGNRHNTFDWFNDLMFYVRCMSSWITLFVMLCGSMQLRHTWKQLIKPELIFFVLLIFAYAFMIIITESYFDRYHIPLITFLIILTAYMSKLYTPNFKLAIIPVVFWMYVSVAGTKDYMTLNTERWNAYWYLRRNLHVPMEQINGGCEVNCYHEGEGWGFRDYLSLNFKYLIQFDPEKDFKPLKEYEFQRYFPYKKDKIYIFVRDDTKNSNEHDQ